MEEVYLVGTGWTSFYLVGRKTIVFSLFRGISGAAFIDARITDVVE